MNWSDMFFQDWQGIVRVLVVGTLAYAALVLFLRLSGKRTLAKLNAFDLVVTIALGSVLSSTLLQESVALVEGATAFGLLIVLQLSVAYFSVRSRRFARLIRSEPSLLARHGIWCETAMQQERVTKEEAISAIRAAGGADLGSVSLMVLESDGSISVVLTDE